MMQILAMFVSVFCFAQGKALVTRGEVFFNGKPVTKDMVLIGQGTFTVGDKSYLKLLLQKSNSTVVIGANSKSDIDFSQKSMFESELNLVKGTARWITGEKKMGGGIHTSNAVMGIRGTDFYASYNPALGESEVVCFDGQVELVNRDNKTESKLVGKNQWGGIGGRFGKKLSDILNLSPDLVSNFKGALPVE